MELNFKKAGGLLANETFRDAIVKSERVDGLKRVAKDTEAQCAITDDNILIITGSNSLKDYWRYNLRPNRFVPISEARRTIAAKIGYQELHQGFLLHATEVLQFLGDDRPDFIVGHSLGAASAQIVATALDVTAITFAAPQVVRRSFLDQPELRRISHPQWNVFNVAWAQDFVTRGYRFTGLRCLGFREVLDLESYNLGIDHFAKDYFRLLEKDEKSAERKVPEAWPDQSYVVPKLA